MSTVLLTAVGTALVAVALYDVFHTLWQPASEGPLSRWLGHAVWRTARRAGPRVRDVAGPVLTVLIVLAWATLIVLGWALVYLGHGDALVFSEALEQDGRDDVVDALYLSMVALSTLGFGDIVPRSGWLGMAAAAQALIGFSLLTASVSWVLQIEPALGRRRALARSVRLLRDVPDPLDGRSLPVETLGTLVQEVARVRVDLGHTAPTYYFRDRDADEALATALPHVARLGEQASTDPDPVRRALGQGLLLALDDLAAHLAARFLDGDHRRPDAAAHDRDAVFAAYARDQGHTVPVEGPDRPGRTRSPEDGAHDAADAE